MSYDTSTPQKTRLIPVTKWNEHHQWPPVGGMRHLIFFAEKNGFEKVIRRCGHQTAISRHACSALHFPSESHYPAILDEQTQNALREGNSCAYDVPALH